MRRASLGIPASCVMQFLGVLVSLWRVDSSGRRPLMVWLLSVKIFWQTASCVLCTESCYALCEK